MRGVPTDVPTHRTSVGAMFVGHAETTRHGAFKPYVYRGTGDDTVDPLLLQVEAEKVERDVEAAKRRIKRKREVEATKRRIKRERAESSKPVPPEPEQEWLAPVIPLFPAGPPAADPEPPVAKPRWSAPPQPAQGWRPPTGADLDAFLDD